MAEENAVVLINNPLPHPLGTRGVRSEVRIEANEERSQEGREAKRSEVQGGGSRTTGGTINAEILKRSQKIKRLERELRELKNAQEGYDQQWSKRQRKPKEVDSLMALIMKPGESLKSYSARYWKTYNEINLCEEDLAVRQFKFGLPIGCKIRQSLTKKPPLNMTDLMSRIEQHVRVEEDGLQPQKQPNNNISALKKSGQPETSKTSLTLFGRPRWLETRSFRESKPYFAYHREKGHLTENCRNYKGFLEELVRNGHLRQFVDDTKHQQQQDHAPKPKVPIGIIDVIHSHARADNLRAETWTTAHLREVFQVCEGATPAPKRLRKETTEEIIFIDRDLERVQLPHSDALVVTMQIGNFDIKRILINPGSSAEIMYDSLFKGLGLGHEDLDRKVDPLYEFSGESIMPIGRVTVKVHAGTISSPTEFWVLNSYSPYNAILGKPWLPKMRDVPSTLHQRLRFPTSERIMEIRGDQDREESDDRLPQKKCAEELVKHQLSASNQEKYFLLGASLPPEQRDGLITLLLEYIDVFAWNPYEAPGVDPAFACHNLNVDPLSRPVVQKGQRISPLHKEAVRKVNRLIEAGAIKEILYPTWLSNTVVVKKKNGKWRVCIDFTDLNKACPKNPFPLPKIDQLVDATSGHQRMSFLDTFQGYHQIAMNPTDLENTAFITPRGIFCYRVMPFGLKNVGATYQRMITKMFTEQLGKTVEVYINDMVVKSIFAEDHLGDLRAVFNTLRQHRLKLNASKCVFGVGSGKFLGFMVTQRGIEANPDQITAILNLKPPRTVREVQRLTGMAVATFHFPTSLDGYPNGEPNLGLMTSDTNQGPRSRDRYWQISLLIHPCGDRTHNGEPCIIHTADGGMEAVHRRGIKLTWFRPKHSAFCPLGANDGTGNPFRISKEYAAKDKKIVAYLIEARRLLGQFKHVQVEHISRDLNGHADTLASLASAVAPELRRIISVRKTERKRTGSEESHLDTGYQKKGISTEGGRSLAHHAIGQRYWWPYMQKDAAQYVKKCDKSQRFAPSIHQPTASLNPIASPWPFSQWGLDIVGPLPRVPGNRQWLIMATNYFTKWVEAEPLTHITDADSKKFVWKNIITRFGIPRVLMSDNGIQFESGPFKTFCEQYGIRNHFSTTAYPQGNEQAESSNKTLLDGIKMSLEKAKGRWVKELSSILWTYRTTPRSST
uniref:Integrase catalytic domain-containing protein n=1 Tax=Fagus sylvatica TaxID=28930 RepID=A0A2N9G037_FAGSY